MCHISEMISLWCHVNYDYLNDGNSHFDRVNVPAAWMEGDDDDDDDDDGDYDYAPAA